MNESKRLAHIQEYYFSAKLKEIHDLNKQGADIINLGIGSPDLPPPKSVVEELIRVSQQPDSHSYQSYRGIEPLREAISDFYQRHYYVEMQAEDEILPLMGSKEGIMHISMAFLNPGDKVLVPSPGYMTYTSATLLAGANPIYYELTEAENYLPNIADLEKMDLTNCKLMWINYPHMPTGARATKNVFKDLIAFAKRHKILLVNDNPYSFILNDNPLSILQVEGAKEVAMELNSLSKSHNMAGWRIGMLLGKASYINAVMKFKSNMDSGMFYALQMAAVKALQIDDDWYKQQHEIYQRRKQIVMQILEALSLASSRSQGGLFVWAKLPEGKKSKEFSEDVLQKYRVFITPGFIFGKQSDGHVRISLTTNKTRLKQVLHRIKSIENV